MKRTPFYEKMLASGGKMVEFCGYEMPIQFQGIVAEHKAVREGAGLFDVSHMAEFMIKGETALNTLEKIMTNDIASMPYGKARYSLMLNENGGVIDDVIVYRFNETEFMVIANASNHDKDKAHILKNRLPKTRFKDITDDTGLLALQGKDSEKILFKIFKTLPKGNYTFIKSKYKGKEVIISRTGYTGEDGFEVLIKNTCAEDFYDSLLKAAEGFNFSLAGLGARDTLRLEAAMPLYGHEMNEETLATELGLSFSIKAHLKDFIGKKAILNVEPKYKRIGIVLIERGIARDGMKLFYSDEEIGYITSGTHSPTLGKPIAMARVLRSFESETLEVDIRNKRVKAEVVALPFYSRNKVSLEVL